MRGRVQSMAGHALAKASNLPPPYSDNPGEPASPPAPEQPQPAPEPEPHGEQGEEAHVDPNRKHKSTALTLSIMLGPIGADRFYLGYTKSAALKLVTLGGFGVWWAADIVLIVGDNLPDRYGEPLLK